MIFQPSDIRSTEQTFGREEKIHYNTNPKYYDRAILTGLSAACFWHTDILVSSLTIVATIVTPPAKDLPVPIARVYR